MPDLSFDATIHKK